MLSKSVAMLREYACLSNLRRPNVGRDLLRPDIGHTTWVLVIVYLCQQTITYSKKSSVANEKIISPLAI